jgi:hypothetical protein
MANPSIRGHQGSISFFQDGALVALFNCTSFELNMDSAFMRSYYTGVAVPEGDQAIEGWSGNADFEVKDSSLDSFIDALITNNLNGIGVSDYSLVLTEDYPDGTTKSYVYSDVQFKLGRKQEGLQAKVTKRLDLQASTRNPL